MKVLGMTLLELLVSLLLGSILLIIFFRFFITALHQDHIFQGDIDEQNNMMLVSHLFYQALYSSGYDGCGLFIGQRAKVLYSPPSWIQANIIAGTNILVVNALSNPDALLYSQKGNKLTVSEQPSFKTYEQLQIVNCQHQQSIVIAKVAHQHSKQKLILKKPLHDSYMPYAEVGRWQKTAFYLASPIKEGSQTTGFTLYRQVRGQRAQAIVDHVQYLHFDKRPEGIKINIKFLKHIVRLFVPLDHLK